MSVKRCHWDKKRENDNETQRHWKSHLLQLSVRLPIHIGGCFVYQNNFCGRQQRPGRKLDICHYLVVVDTKAMMLGSDGVFVVVKFSLKSCWQMFLLLLNCLKTNLARQSNCLCPADNDDRSSRAPSPPSLFINPSNLPQLSFFFQNIVSTYFAFLTASNSCRSEQNPTGSRFSRNVPVNRKGSCGMIISCSRSSSRSSILMLTVSM